MSLYAGSLAAPVRSSLLNTTGVAVDPMAVYQRAQVLGATPMQLILMLYDLVLVACGRREAQRASRAIIELIAALNFEYEEIAVGLFRLYEYALGQIRSGSFDEAAKIIRQLKDAWETALREAEVSGGTYGTQ